MPYRSREAAGLNYKSLLLDGTERHSTMKLGFPLVLLGASATFALPTSPTTPLCKDIHVFFARGTTELPPLGHRIGPQFLDVLSTMLSSTHPALSLSFVGIDYPADLIGYLEGGDPTGGINMASEINNILHACPDAKIVMSGYRCIQFEPLILHSI